MQPHEMKLSQHFLKKKHNLRKLVLAIFKKFN